MISPVNTGWICPKCSTSNAPWARSCIGCQPKAQVSTDTFTGTRSLADCACRTENGGSGVCGCILGNQIIS